MTITEKLTQIKELCDELGIDPHMYANVTEHGRLIFRLSEFCVFKKGDLKAGRITPPDPKDFMGGKNGKK